MRVAEEDAVKERTVVIVPESVSVFVGCFVGSGDRVSDADADAVLKEETDPVEVDFAVTVRELNPDRVEDTVDILDTVCNSDPVVDLEKSIFDTLCCCDRIIVFVVRKDAVIGNEAELDFVN